MLDEWYTRCKYDSVKLEVAEELRFSSEWITMRWELLCQKRKSREKLLMLLSLAVYLRNECKNLLLLLLNICTYFGFQFVGTISICSSFLHRWPRQFVSLSFWRCSILIYRRHALCIVYHNIWPFRRRMSSSSSSSSGEGDTLEFV